jgi:hypothetical protein
MAVENKNSLDYILFGKLQEDCPCSYLFRGFLFTLLFLQNNMLLNEAKFLNSDKKTVDHGASINLREQTSIPWGDVIEFYAQIDYAELEKHSNAAGIFFCFLFWYI